MNILIVNEQDSLRLSKVRVRNIIREVLFFKQEPCDELSIHFVDTKTISQLHKDYFDDPSTTDCISFPMDASDEVGYRVLGELFVCPQTAIDYCKKKGGDPYVETTLYIVHGILHLLGHDDLEPTAKRRMRREEKKVMTHLTRSNLFLQQAAQPKTSCY